MAETPAAAQPVPTAASRAGIDVVDADRRRLFLHKQDRQFVFEYRPGEEAQVLAALRGLAEDAEHPLQWFDAALLSDQLGRAMRARLKPAPPV